MQSNKNEIFKGLPSMTEEAAKDLANYLRVADGAVGIIDAKGRLTTPQKEWDRPMAGRNFEVLHETLKESNVPWVEVQEDQIRVDFSRIEYNVEWLKKIITKYQLGVSDSECGLKLYRRNQINSKTWYEDQGWRIQGVTVASLGLEKSEVVSLNMNSENPDEAEWQKLHFAA